VPHLDNRGRLSYKRLRVLLRRRPGGLALTAIAVTASALLPLGAGAQPDVRSPGSRATACNGSYCVVGGTTTLTLSNAWRRKAAAGGVRFGTIAPAAQRGGRITLPIARVAVGRDGYARAGQPSSWYLEGCNVIRGGGGLAHRGGLTLTAGGRKRSVRALVEGPRLVLEVPEPGTWKTGQKPKPFSLALAFGRWQIGGVTPTGFTAQAELRVSRTRGLNVPAGVAGRLKLDVRVSPRIAGLGSDVACGGFPITPLPRASGVMYPLLLGDMRYRTPMKAVYERLGRGVSCYSVCTWRHERDYAAFGGVDPVDGRTGVDVLFDSFAVEAENLGSSRLKGWRTPEGVRIGTTVAELLRTYPQERIGCIGDDCIMAFLTRPYRIPAGGQPTRQRFVVRLGMIRQNPVHFLEARLHGEEGTCSVSWQHERDDMQFEGHCFGPLVSARLEAVGASPRIGREPQAYGELDSVVDDAGAADTPGGLPALVDGSTTAARVTWRVVCDLGATPECPPGRGGGAPDMWPRGGFEEWDIGFTGYSAQPAPPRAPGANAAVPPMRFTAEFLGLPLFTIVISRDP
jgi:hypothetical protein